MTALAVVGCVALVCASSLLAWRWWLDASTAAARKTVVDYEAAAARLGEFERRLESLEVRFNFKR